MPSGLAYLNCTNCGVGWGGGADQSFCLLMSATRSDPRSATAAGIGGIPGRLFYLRKWICAFGGQGQVLGTRQSGLPDFALASLVADQAAPDGGPDQRQPL
jgi:ATP-dependent DNA helicase RecG